MGAFPFYAGKGLFEDLFVPYPLALLHTEMQHLFTLYIQRGDNAKFVAEIQYFELTSTFGYTTKWLYHCMCFSIKC